MYITETLRKGPVGYAPATIRMLAGSPRGKDEVRELISNGRGTAGQIVVGPRKGSLDRVTISSTK